MLIIGSFQYCLELEEALAELEHNGIIRNHILAVPMYTFSEISKDVLMNQSADFYSKAIEVGMASATACSVIGTSVGFILRWGPIIWGLAGGGIGFIVGFGLYYLFSKNSNKNNSMKVPEVIIIVQCPQESTDMVMKIMKKNCALTIGQVSNLLQS